MADRALIRIDFRGPQHRLSFTRDMHFGGWEALRSVPLHVHGDTIVVADTRDAVSHGFVASHLTESGTQTTTWMLRLPLSMPNSNWLLNRETADWLAAPATEGGPPRIIAINYAMVAYLVRTMMWIEIPGDPESDQPPTLNVGPFANSDFVRHVICEREQHYRQGTVRLILDATPRKTMVVDAVGDPPGTLRITHSSNEYLPNHTHPLTTADRATAATWAHDLSALLRRIAFSAPGMTHFPSLDAVSGAEMAMRFLDRTDMIDVVADEKRHHVSWVTIKDIRYAALLRRIRSMQVMRSPYIDTLPSVPFLEVRVPSDRARLITALTNCVRYVLTNDRRLLDLGYTLAPPRGVTLTDDLFIWLRDRGIRANHIGLVYRDNTIYGLYPPDGKPTALATRSNEGAPFVATEGHYIHLIAALAWVSSNCALALFTHPPTTKSTTTATAATDAVDV